MPGRSQSTQASTPVDRTDRLTLDLEGVDLVDVTMTAQADHVVAMIAGGRVPDSFRAACRSAGTSLAKVAGVYSLIHEAATRGADGSFAFTGYLKDLVCDGFSYRTVRRGFAVLRAVGLLVGLASDVHYDERRGVFGRVAALYETVLPKWVGRCRKWRRHPRGRERAVTRAGSLESVIAPTIGVQKPGATVPDFPVHNDDWRAGVPIPAAVRAEIDRLMAKKGRGRR